MDAPTTALLITLAFHVNVNVDFDINKAIDQLKKSKPVVPEDLNINASDEIKLSENISVTVGRAQKTTGSLGIVKTTNNPTPKELELIQAARGNRPYNSIFGVQIGYNEKGSIISLQWNEN